MSKYALVRYMLGCLSVAAILLLQGCGGNGNNSPAAAVTVPASVTAFSQTLSTSKNVPITITLQGSSSSARTMVFNVKKQPVHGVLTGQMSGTTPVMNYTPALDYFGVDSFTFSATDASGNTSSSGIITLQILNQISPLTDTDGDGLTDLAELNKWHTNPNMADTDGDSLSDWREVVDLAFDPLNNNFKFNPLIADEPKLGIELVSAPSFSLDYTTSSGTSSSVTTQRSKASSTSVSGSTTDSTSQSVASTWEVGAEISKQGPTVSGSYSQTTTDETSHSFTTTQSSENSLASSRGKSFEQNNSITSSSGNVAVAVRVVNKGSLPFTLKNLQLSATEVDSNGQIGNALGGMNLDGVKTFPAFSLVPGQSSGPLIFRSTSYDVSTAYRLMDNSTGLRFPVSLSQTVDANGVPFAFNQTDLSNKNAVVIIDYGDKLPTERYKVSTVGNPSTLYVTAANALTNILKIPYTADASGLLRIRKVASVPGNPKSLWLGVYSSGNGVQQSVTVYDNTGTNPNPAGTSVYKRMSLAALQSLQLHAGDTLRLMLMEDLDGDGLETRQERFLGTNPMLKDTDGDKIADNVELAGWNVTVTGAQQPIWNSVGYGRTGGWPSSPSKQSSGYSSFKGDLDEIRFWNVPRTQAQLAANQSTAITMPQTNLMGYWPLNSITPGQGTSPWPGTDAIEVDASGHGRDMAIRNTANNNITNNATPVRTGAAGTIGNYFHLDGVDDNLTLPAFTFMTPNSITLEARFRCATPVVTVPPTPDSNGVIFAYQSPEGSYHVPAVYVGLDGKLRANFYGSGVGGSRQIITTAASVEDGKWHHVALVYDDTLVPQQQFLYLDGVLVGSTLGKKDKIIASTYHTQSNPVIADTDGDTLPDGIEKTGASDPSTVDTDGDWIHDNVDPLPFVMMSLDITKFTASVPTVTLRSTLNFDVPRVLPSDGVSDYQIALLEQSAAPGKKSNLAGLPADNASPLINTFLTCKNGLNCWKIISNSYSLGQPSKIVSNAHYALTRTVSPNTVNSYKVLIRVNGVWHESSKTTSAYQGATVKITVRGLNILSVYCFDGGNDYRCEHAWQNTLNGKPVGTVPDKQVVTNVKTGDVLTKGLNSVQSEASVVVPDGIGSCVNLQTMLTEFDPPRAFYRKYHTAKLCYEDGWGSAGVDSFSMIKGNNPWNDSMDGNIRILSGLKSSGGPAFRGSYIYQGPTLWMKGKRYNSSLHHLPEVAARATYHITVSIP